MERDNRKIISKNSPLFFIIIAAVVFVLDQFTKQIIKTNVTPFDVIRVLPFFNIVYAENVGSAFGMFKSLGNAFFVAVAGLAAVVITVMIWKDKENRLGLSLILGGAVGNLADRIIYGYVIDFLDCHAAGYHWPAFNVADSALTVGTTLIIVKMFLPNPRVS
ncbi:MAG: signal peptidase II [Nitrospirae bacterium]|nr:signal peptidase II [Nitrospirota bacterium]